MGWANTKGLYSFLQTHKGAVVSLVSMTMYTAACLYANVLSWTVIATNNYDKSVHDAVTKIC